MDQHPVALRRDKFLLGLLFSALCFRLWHINWGLPYLYEEAMPLNVAWQMWNWGSQGLNFLPRVEGKEHFFIYPAFTFFLNFIAQSIQYFGGHLTGAYPTLSSFKTAFETDPSTFVITARLIVIAFDVGIVALVYMIGIQFFSRSVAITASILIAINPLHIKQAHLINVDTPLTFFVVLCIYFLLRLHRDPRTKWYLWTGIAAGLATASKYNGGLLFIVLALGHVLTNSTSSKNFFSKLIDQRFLYAVLVGCGVFIMFNPFILIDSGAFIEEFVGVQQHMELGHLGAESTTAVGTLEHYFMRSLPFNLGWLTVLIGVCTMPLILVIRSLRTKENVLLLLFPVLYAATVGTWSAYADRYIFPIVPLLIVIACVGVDRLLSYLVDRLNLMKGLKSARLFFLSQSALVLLSLGYAPALSSFGYHTALGQPDTRTIVADWIRKNVPPKGAIATGPYMLDFSKDPFVIVPIPFNAGQSELTFAFYDARWFEDLDLVVTSDYDYGRYQLDTQRFKDILPFYDTLKVRWKKTFEVQPKGGQLGYAFSLYTPPTIFTNDVFDSSLMQRLRNAPATYRSVFAGRLGLFLASKGKLEKSEQLLQVVLETDQNNLAALGCLVRIAVNKKESEEALSLSNTYLKIAPNDPEMLALRGNVLIRLGQMQEAEESLLLALRANPKIESVYLDLLMVYGVENNTAKATDILTLYLRILPPNSPKANIITEQLERLRKRAL